MVNDTIKIAKPDAAGPSPRGDPDASPISATQAVWRFLNNDRIALPDLAQPLREAGAAAAMRTKSQFMLVVHDWSKLDYKKHRAKKDVVQLTHEHDIGYELSTRLLVSTDDGQPLAAMEMGLLTADGMLSTNPEAVDRPHINQVLPGMKRAEEWNINKTMVHVIDREVDSIYHYRLWNEEGFRFLVRGDDRIVRLNGEEVKFSEIVLRCLDDDEFQVTGRVKYKKKHAICSVCERTVVLDRSAHVRIDGRRQEVSGKPIELRLVMTNLTDEKTGSTLATWYLLTNVSADVADTQMVSQWYYWRWRIENYFKLLKGHGLEIEHWQQESGMAIARRLLVSSMACIVVWDLMSREDDDATQMKDLLIRLSGRRMKRGVRYTAPALLAGLFVLLPIMIILDEECGGLSITDLRQLARRTIPLLNMSV